MERNLEVMMEERKLLEEEKKPLSEAINTLNKKIKDLDNEIETYKLSNTLYHPMSELIKYKGKEISSITLVERNEDGTLDTEFMYNDEMFSVDEEGYLDYSSYNCGVMSYDKDIGKYVMWCHYHRTEHDYVGFLEIELWDGEDDEDDED